MFFQKKDTKVGACKLCLDNSEELLKLFNRIEMLNIKYASLETQFKSVRQKLMQHLKLEPEQEEETQSINNKLSPFN